VIYNSYRHIWPRYTPEKRNS